MNKQHICKIIKKEKLLPDIYRFVIEAEDIAKQAEPGQFLEIKCGDGIEPLLRRPISISNIEKNSGLVEFIIQVRGKATKLLSKKEAGDKLDILGPLGNGFTINKDRRRVAIVGGGIGIFPLLYLAKKLKNSEVIIYLGFRNKEMIVLENEMKSVSSSLKITTDDGSYGYHGLVTDVLENDLKQEKFDMLYACGPQPLLKKVGEIATTHKIDCEISVEERMCCGVGACLGCACKVKDDEDDWKYGHVCKDGPVFNVKEIILE